MSYKDGRSRHPFYGKWCNIIQRCANPNVHQYKDYGGRGIKVCDAWLDPFAFYEWCEDNGYEKGLDIDRKDREGDYTPENCRFTTHRSNSINRGIPSTNKSGFRGVSWSKQVKKWRAQITVNGKCKHLGYFISPTLAACRYDFEAIKEGYQTNF